MTTKPSSLIEHLELYFGKIESGWKSKEWADSAIQIVECRHGNIPGVIVVSTLGLSNFAMKSRVSGKEIRQELFVILKAEQVDPKLPAALDQIARECARTDKPVLRGEVVEKEGHLLLKGDFVALYATLPIYYPNASWTFQAKEGEIAFCWFLPIKAEEKLYIQQHGWSAFEEILDKATFDLFDLGRQSLL